MESKRSKSFNRGDDAYGSKYSWGVTGSKIIELDMPSIRAPCWNIYALKLRAIGSVDIIILICVVFGSGTQ